MTTYKLLHVWTAQRTLPVRRAARLIAMFRIGGRPHSYRVHAGSPALVTITFTMATLS
jgi:hypothetical protein